MSAAAFDSELQELSAWVSGVGQLPLFLRTRAARDLFGALERSGLTRAEELNRVTSLEEVAAKVGMPRDGLVSALRKCPFGVSF